MADSTHIQWSDATWNFVTGCTKISKGCDNCYIERTPPFRMQHRSFSLPGVGGTTGVQLHRDRLDLPIKWRKPRRIFVNSLADLFHDDVPEQIIVEAFAVMALTARHTYQVLTKRPARMRSVLSSPDFRERVQRAALTRAGDKAPWLVEPWWPLSNVWLGVSAEDQKWADIRIPILLTTPAAVRWISAEPLLGPIDLTRITYTEGGGTHLDVVNGRHGVPDLWVADGKRIDWLVVGGESGKNARPMFPDWARSLRDQCVTAGVPFFYKQTGEWMDLTPGIAPGREIRAYPGALLQRAGKRLAGRELDGREWNEFPVTRTELEVSHA